MRFVVKRLLHLALAYDRRSAEIAFKRHHIPHEKADENSDLILNPMASG